jgi:hypothetical protein
MQVEAYDRPSESFAESDGVSQGLIDFPNKELFSGWQYWKNWVFYSIFTTEIHSS